MNLQDFNLLNSYSVKNRPIWTPIKHTGLKGPYSKQLLHYKDMPALHWPLSEALPDVDHASYKSAISDLRLRIVELHKSEKEFRG